MKENFFFNVESDGRGRILFFLRSFKTFGDIIWFDQLERYDELLQVHHILSQEEHPEYHKGRVNQALLEELLPAKHDKSKVFICGPIPFYKECEKSLEPLHYRKNEIIRFEG